MSEQSKETSPKKFTPLAKLLHWGVAALVFTQFWLSFQAELAAENGNAVQQLNILAHHKSIGMTVLLLMCLRIAWRLKNKPPMLPKTMPAWQQRLASVSHWLVYAALFILPLSGWLGSSAKAFTVSWFSLFSFPDLVTANTDLGDMFYLIHGATAMLLMLMILLHIAAALKHHLIDKDSVLTTMFSLRWAVFLIAVIFSAISLTRNAENPVQSVDFVPEEGASNATLTRNEVSNAITQLSPWAIDYGASTSQFYGEQAGAEFEGVFNEWEAIILFDADQLDLSYFEVEFDLSQAVTGNNDRDSQLQNERFFYVEQFPTALFTTLSISQEEDSFLAESILTLKGLETPVNFWFTVAEQGERIILEGEAELDRLEMMVGTGTWTNTNSIGQMVTVRVHVEATL